MSEDELGDLTLELDSVPEEASPIESRETATRKLKDPKELTSDSPMPDVPNSDIPYRALTWFMHSHAFVTFFGWLADKQYPSAHNGSTRFRKHKLDHPGLYWFCVTIDLILMGLVILIILTAVSITIYKTLWL